MKTNIEQIGTYLDRSVKLQIVNSLTTLEIDDLSHAVVLVWLAPQSFNSNLLEIIIKQLIAQNVLSIVVAGESPNESFSILLLTLSTIHTIKHIMTGVIESTCTNDIIEQFLVATWPDENRFDYWTEYRLIVIGNSDLGNHVKIKLISSFIDR